MSDPYQDENLDQVIELNLSTVKKRAVRGVAILTGRGFLLNFISQASQLLLLAFLSPSELGIFWIISAAVGFLIYFSDIGLAAALIQKKEKPTSDDLKTTFTIQQGLVIILLAVLFIISPYLVKLYNLSTAGKFLLYAVGFSFFLTSLKSIPSVLLERKLQFGKFVFPEILENLAYNLTVVFLAYKGFGITSFTYAVVIRGIIGVVAIYSLQPWMPGIAFSKRAVKGLLKFGVPYQFNTLISVVKDQGITLLLGGILGTTAIGYLGTAQRISQLPLRIFMDNVGKVAFPAFSRMQHHKKELARAVTRSVLFITFLVFPSIIGLVTLAPWTIVLIPKYAKWEPSLILLYIMSINTIFAAIATLLSSQLLMAIGKIKITIQITLMYSVLTLSLVPFLAIKNGVLGASIGYAIVGVSSIIAILAAKRQVNFSIIQSSLKPLLASTLMGAYILILRNYLSISILNITFLILSSSILYALISYALFGKSLITDAKKILSSIFKK